MDPGAAGHPSHSQAAGLADLREITSDTRLILFMRAAVANVLYCVVLRAAD